MVQVNRTLTELDVANNAFGSSVAVPFAECFKVSLLVLVLVLVSVCSCVGELVRMYVFVCVGLGW